MKDASIKRKDSELEAKSRALGETDATISAMSELITKTRQYLATSKQQVSAHTTCVPLINCRYLKETINC